MMTTIHDAPTLTLIAARTTGALAEARSRDHMPSPLPTINSALHDLFMEVMAFYTARRDLTMSLALVQTLDQAFAAIHTHRGEFLLLNLMVEIIERDVSAACDPGVRLAVAQAASALNHAYTS